MTLAATVPLPPPKPPLLPGWWIAYRDSRGKLRGGADEPARGTVAAMVTHPTGWVVRLTDGSTVHQTRVLSVGRTDGEGKLLEAWTVRDHGIDGMKGGEATQDRYGKERS